MGPGVGPGYDNIPDTAGNEEWRALNTIRRGWQTGQEGRKVLESETQRARKRLTTLDRCMREMTR